ncbi:hypothetical protein BD410DRAFT_795148 [Rickenella mellea]|uniref:CFEM domain-containing protein n=1 Tax=Rickenella mellea TaxID=50990 RepID=A0A4Y7PQ72_9AGAM|nr:hypothetical protein BD410DRAFT_795148 [Rickenella mellea]
MSGGATPPKSWHKICIASRLQRTYKLAGRNTQFDVTPMFFTTIISCFFFGSMVFGSPQITQCGNECIIAAANAMGCANEYDLPCLCKSESHVSFLRAVATCACSAPERASVISLQQSECQSVSTPASGNPPSTTATIPSTATSFSVTTSSQPTTTPPSSDSSVVQSTSTSSGSSTSSTTNTPSGSSRPSGSITTAPVAFGYINGALLIVLGAGMQIFV